MTKREAEELIEIEIDGTEKQECTEERYIEIFHGTPYMIIFIVVFLISKGRLNPFEKLFSFQLYGNNIFLDFKDANIRVFV